MVQADPIDQTADEPLAFRRRVEAIDDPPVHKAKVAGIQGNGDVRQTIERSFSYVELDARVGSNRPLRATKVTSHVARVTTGRS